MTELSPIQLDALRAQAALAQRALGQRIATPAPAQPATPDLGGTFGAPLSRAISDELYQQGPIGRPFTPTPESVQAADGSTMYLNPETGQYTNAELMAGSMRPSQGQAALAGAAQGVTLGAGDELAGMIAGPMVRERGRAAVLAARRDYPKTALASEIAGAVALPIGGVSAATAKGAAVAGAKAGAAYGGFTGAMSADGSIKDRLAAGLEGAIAGSIFGAAAPFVAKGVSAAYRAMATRAAKRPSIESLRATKNAAYDAVDKSGAKFTPDEVKGVGASARAALAEDPGYLPEVDTLTEAFLNRLDTMGAREITIGQLDKLRSAIWSRYNTSKEHSLLTIVDSIDEAVAAKPATGPLIDAARQANARYKKAETIDLALTKAQDRAAVSGDVASKFRQALINIIDSPKQARWFSKEEIDLMRGFVHGSVPELIARRIGKLAPTGNGLMTALNLMASASFGPTALAASAIASGARGVAESAARRGADRLVGTMAGQPPVSAVLPYSTRLSGPAGSIAGQR